MINDIPDLLQSSNDAEHITANLPAPFADVENFMALPPDAKKSDVEKPFVQAESTSEKGKVVLADRRRIRLIAFGITTGLLFLASIVYAIVSASSPSDGSPASGFGIEEPAPESGSSASNFTCTDCIPDFGVGSATCVTDWNLNEKQILCTQDFTPATSDVTSILVEGDCTNMSLPEPAGLTSITSKANGEVTTEISYDGIQNGQLAFCLKTSVVYSGLEMYFEKTPFEYTFAYDGSFSFEVQVIEAPKNTSETELDVTANTSQP